MSFTAGVAVGVLGTLGAIAGAIGIWYLITRSGEGLGD